MKDSIIDKILCSTGYLPPRNEDEMTAFEKVYSKVVVKTDFRVDMNGKMEITDVKISPDAIDPADPSMTEQLVKAACTDAYNKMKQKINEEFSSRMGGLPPGFAGM